MRKHERTNFFSCLYRLLLSKVALFNIPIFVTFFQYFYSCQKTDFSICRTLLAIIMYASFLFYIIVVSGNSLKFKHVFYISKISLWVLWRRRKCSKVTIFNPQKFSPIEMSKKILSRVIYLFEFFSKIRIYKEENILN